MKVTLKKPYALSDKVTLEANVELSVSSSIYEKLKAGGYIKEPSEKVKAK